MSRSIAALAFALLAVGTAITARADISLTSMDDFSVNSEGWSIGDSGIQPTRLSNPGIDGLPGLLEHYSDGSGEQRRFLMWSDDTDWQGDYTTAGVTGIRLWADNRAGNPLDLRIAFGGAGGWFYSAAQTITNLTAGDDWTPLTYDLVNFTYAANSGGTGEFADTLADVTRFQILGGGGTPTYRSAGNALRIDASTNTVRFDNISAVPEPSSILLFVLGGTVTVAWSLHRKRGSGRRK